MSWVHWWLDIVQCLGQVNPGVCSFAGLLQHLLQGPRHGVTGLSCVLLRHLTHDSKTSGGDTCLLQSNDNGHALLFLCAIWMPVTITHASNPVTSCITAHSYSANSLHTCPAYLITATAAETHIRRSTCVDHPHLTFKVTQQSSCRSMDSAITACLPHMSLINQASEPRLSSRHSLL